MMHPPYYKYTSMTQQLMCLCPLNPICYRFSADIRDMNAAVSKKSIYLQGSDGKTVAFPWIFKYVSAMIASLPDEYLEDQTQPDRKRTPFHSSLLQIVSNMVSSLPSAARNVYGISVPITRFVYPTLDISPKQDTSEEIILVNSEVTKAITPYLAISNPILANLLNAADYFLISSLRSALASTIANRLSRSFKKYRYFSSLLSDDAFKNAVEKALSKDEFGSFSELPFSQILRHVYLRLIGTKEKTVADLIGLKGQPPLDPGNKMNLQFEALTGLLGLDLIIKKDNITTLNLAYNHIINVDFDYAYFQGYTTLKSLDLTHNKLSQLPERFFTGLSNLSDLRLTSNELLGLPEHLFRGLTSLQHLYLNNNQLSELPEMIFFGLKALKRLEVQDNYIEDTIEEFEARHSLPMQTQLIFYPQIDSLYALVDRRI